MSYQARLSQTQCIQSFQSGQYRTKFGFIALIIFIIAISFYIRPVFAAESCDAKIQHIQVAKAVGANGTQRPDNDWIKIDSFPDNIDSRWFGYSGSVWYQVRFDYQCYESPHSPITLVINSIHIAGQIYINDDLLWSDQSLVEPLSRSWNMPRYWNLPASSLKQGENILWIRVISVAKQNSGIGHVLLGTANDVMPTFQKFWREQRVLMFFNLVFSLALGIVTFFVWLFHRQDSIFGWFFLASLTWVMIMTNVVMLNAPFGLTTLQVNRINIICIFAYSIFSCFYAWRLAQHYFPRLEKVLFFGLSSAVIMIILLSDAVLYEFILILFILSILILLINFLTYPYIAYRSKQLEAYLLAGIFIFFMIVSVHDTLIIALRQNIGSLWTPYTAPLATLLIAIVLAMRISKNIQKIQNFNKTLTEKVTQAQKELAISMNMQHQLELENVKLQERIHLAHDLHDGLGGSLVRSMAIIDQSKENLSNPQFLSMLKLLRDDLRQIIDSGSSSGAEVPKTPMIWGAAIRYRFIQIFDELDIQSTWHFPETWQIQPTTLECLTLLRVIEESLTNIIKHSSAHQVKVNLFFNTEQQLILQIEDDGVGFNVDAVLNAGISVGLRSMKIRLEKMNAKMYIQSETGKTLIQVVKTFHE